MTAAELRAKWAARRAEWSALAVRVDGERVAGEILADLAQLVEEDLISLPEASRIGGYSVDHLQRLVRAGTIPNYGRKYAPRIRRSDVPTKPGHSPAPVSSLPSAPAADQLSARRRIVADAQHRGA